MKRGFARLLGCLCVVAGMSTAVAQPYPSKVVTLIVPFAAGGPSDTTARLLAQTMTASLKQQVIVENLGGAGGTIGAAKAAKAAPDGYTLFVHHIGHATAPALYRKLPYDPIADFEPIGLINDGAMTLVSRPGFPPKDFRELLTYVKANKDKVTIANAGVGSASHLCGMLFMTEIQADLTTVPYKGTAPAMNDMLGGTVDFMCDQSTNTTSHIKAGKIRVYGVASAARVASMPEVPTLAEAGLPNFRITVWHALYAPRGTPQPVIDRLAGALQEALTDPNLKQRFAELGAEPATKGQATPAWLRAHLKAEIDKWGPIIRKAGVYAD